MRRRARGEGLERRRRRWRVDKTREGSIKKKATDLLGEEQSLDAHILTLQKQGSRIVAGRLNMTQR